MVAVGVLTWTGVAGYCGTAHADPTGPPVAIESYVTRALALGLDRDPYWHVLLHYRPVMVAGMRWPLRGGGLESVVSEVDDPAFFRAATGRHDPAAELEATIRALWLPPASDVQEPPLGCRFPARDHWLRQRLAVDPVRHPPPDCPRFTDWVAGLSAEQVVLVFPAAYLNNPASMFGHTLLRMDNPARPDLLDYAINYGADVPENTGMMYALKGVSGGYRGRFSTLPFYAKVRQYGEYENRDIWEYRLNLTGPELDRMLRHAWELHGTWFRYYFFRENCAYHLLSLLESARPGLELRAVFTRWTVPTDTLRRVIAAGLVADTTFRPARSTRIRAREAGMTARQIRLATRVARSRMSPEHLAAAGVGTGAERAAVLDLAADYLQYEATRDGDLAVASRKEAVLRARAREATVTGEAPVATPDTPPHGGHATQRWTLGGGRRLGGAFAEIGYRAAYHDVLDPAAGYDATGTLAFMHVVLRKRADGGLSLWRLQFPDILSLSPWQGFIRPVSWKMLVQWEGGRVGTCAACGVANFNGGTGVSAYVPGSGGRVVGYVLAELDMNVGPRLSRNHALGAGPRLGLLATWNRRLKTHASWVYWRYPLGDRLRERRVTVAQRITLSDRYGVRIRYQNTRSRRVAGAALNVSLHGYF